jgi:Zinc finger, C2H2 type
MKEELRIHSFIHFDGEIHTCTECHQIFKKKKLLVYHMAKHESPTYRCDQCQKLFKYRSNLGKHQREGRCKPLEELQPTQSAEEEAVLAKRQLIAMTVNQSKLNIDVKSSVNAKIDEEHLIEENFIEEEETLKIERVGDVVDDPFDPESEKLDCVITFNVEAEANASLVEKKAKRVYLKKKPMKIMKKSSTPYKCDSCDFICDKKCQILSHIRYHVASVRHKCK